MLKTKNISPLIATIIANAEPRGSAPIVLDNSLAYCLTISGSKFKFKSGSFSLNWLNIAMSIHRFDYISDDKLGYDKFLEWSKGGGKSYKGVGDIRTTWNSIKPSSNGVGVGTLFTIAYEYGYVTNLSSLI
jgi:hypothetical protein